MDEWMEGCWSDARRWHAKHKQLQNTLTYHLYIVHREMLGFYYFSASFSCFGFQKYSRNYSFDEQIQTHWGSLLCCVPLLSSGGVSGPGSWVRISQPVFLRCFRTLLPEVGPSRCKCTSPQSPSPSMMSCLHPVFLASLLWWPLCFVVTFLRLTWLCCTERRRPTGEIDRKIWEMLLYMSDDPDWHLIVSQRHIFPVFLFIFSSYVSVQWEKTQTPQGKSSFEWS